MTPLPNNAGGVPDSTRDWRRPLIELGVHVLVGTTLFVIIACPAVALDFLMQWLKALGIDSIIIPGLGAVKVVLFTVDVLLFLVFLANTAWRYVRSFRWTVR